MSGLLPAINGPMSGCHARVANLGHWARGVLSTVRLLQGQNQRSLIMSTSPANDLSPHERHLLNIIRHEKEVGALLLPYLQVGTSATTLTSNRTPQAYDTFTKSQDRHETTRLEVELANHDLEAATIAVTASADALAAKRAVLTGVEEELQNLDQERQDLERRLAEV